MATHVTRSKSCTQSINGNNMIFACLFRCRNVSRRTDRVGRIHYFTSVYRPFNLRTPNHKIQIAEVLKASILFLRDPDCSSAYNSVPCAHSKLRFYGRSRRLHFQYRMADVYKLVTQARKKAVGMEMSANQMSWSPLHACFSRDAIWIVVLFLQSCAISLEKCVAVFCCRKHEQHGDNRNTFASINRHSDESRKRGETREKAKQ